MQNTSDHGDADTRSTRDAEEVVQAFGSNLDGITPRGASGRPRISPTRCAARCEHANIGGETVLERLRTSTPAPPVIMVTASQDEAQAKRLLAAGAFDYVAKPVDLTYLQRAIGTAAATYEMKA